MERAKKGWKKVPRDIRRVIVLILGSIFIIAAGLTGWLPGPGGIPLFLIGIAILSTEFEWAARLRDWTIDQIHAFGHWYRQNRVAGTIFIAICIAGAMSFAYFMYRYIW